MNRFVALTVVFVGLAGCEDQSTTSPNRPNSAVPSPTILPGQYTKDPQFQAPPGWPPVDPHFIVPPTIKVFDGQVVAKEADRFVVRGLSGRHYLIIPSHHLTGKPPDNLAFINFDQIQVGQNLQVRLSAKVPMAAAYVCDGVTLRGVRMPDGRELLPYDPQRDD